MRTLGTCVLAALAVLAVSVTARAAGPDIRREQLPTHYKLAQPDGAGPFPAVLLASGCSGFDARFGKAHYDDVQSKLVALGFLTVRVDYLVLRGAGNCISVPTEEVAGDIAWVVADLKRRPLVKPGAINLLGWSRGGAGALQSLAQEPGRQSVQVAAVAAYYPVCAYVKPWDSPVPVLVLHGTLDDVAPPSMCEALYKQLPASTHLTTRMFEGARHAFDVAELPAEFHYAFGTLGSNPEAAAKAWEALAAFIRH